MKKVLILLIIFVTMFTAPLTVYAADEVDFKELFDNHQSIMLIIHPITGDIYYANAAAAEFYGYPLETLIEMNINDINTLSPKEVADERLRALKEEREFFIFKHRLANGEIKTVHVYSYPMDINGETYLFSIVIDQTEFILLEDRQNNLTLIIILLLIAVALITSAGLIVISQKNKSLKESERFKALQDISFGGVVIHDQGIVLDCNKRLLAITGYDYEELVGMKGPLLIAAETRDYVTNYIKSGYELPYETKGIRKNGEIYPLIIESKSTPYRGKQVMITEFRDITEIKKVEAESIRMGMQWDRLIHEMPLGFNLREMVWDEKGNPINYRFLDINDAYQTMTGLKKEDIIGKLATEIIPEIEPSWIEKYGEVVLKKETMAIDDYSRGLKKYFRVVSYPYIDDKFIVIAEDITDRKFQEKVLIEKESEKGRIIDSLPGVYFQCKLDSNWTMLYMSEQCEKLTGYQPIDFINNKKLSFNDLIIPKYKDYLMKSWLESKKHDQTNNVEYEIIKKDGTTAWIWEKGKTFIRNGEWLIEGFLMDITVEKQIEEKVIYASNHDSLTGLPNRRYFDDKLKELDNPKNYPLVITMMDIDGLKLINDTYGHFVGDQAIKKVADMLTKFCLEPTIVSRIGGDEFLILSPKATLETYKPKLDDLITKISQIKIKEIQLSLSFGTAVKNDQSMRIDDVITEAENHMYSNKVLRSQSSRNQAISAIFNSLKEKHDEERKHSDRVSRYCAMMGEKLNLSENERLELEFAGRMHDIGKITIPDHILNKPGKLTEDEWEIMKAHTTNGYQILRSADKYSKLAEYALTHHERIDGKGYPQGLKGDEIPLFSRIISICDAYEAMTSDRSYRKAFTKEVAIEELKRCAGTQFDSKLVNVFINEVIVNE
ncbi:MAG: PAS domain S-box protein [Acholeplasmataceae bacterium]|jgi:diguanylate cyclase (GGDEF)-like protein/PAS domain S-box-containing protein